MTSEPYFLDSNILIYSVVNGNPQKRLIASEIVKKGLAGSLELYISPQVLLEVFSIITSTKKMQIPLPSSDAKRLIEIIVSSKIKLVYPGEKTLSKLLEFIDKEKPAGARIFGLYIAATMSEYGVKKIYTENTIDFQGLRGIEPINPFSKL
ncbi:MAG: PIN domain-containing protein [Thermodesulfovibrionia bacterium]|nr:PIN domain-containing protein [Thermodesulfovibrionia bacterium]